MGMVYISSVRALRMWGCAAAMAALAVIPARSSRAAPGVAHLQGPAAGTWVSRTACSGPSCESSGSSGTSERGNDQGAGTGGAGGGGDNGQSNEAGEGGNGGAGATTPAVPATAGPAAAMARQATTTDGQRRNRQLSRPDKAGSARLRVLRSDGCSPAACRGSVRGSGVIRRRAVQSGPRPSCRGSRACGSPSPSEGRCFGGDPTRSPTMRRRCSTIRFATWSTALKSSIAV